MSFIIHPRMTRGVIRTLAAIRSPVERSSFMIPPRRVSGRSYLSHIQVARTVLPLTQPVFCVLFNRSGCSRHAQRETILSLPYYRFRCYRRNKTISCRSDVPRAERDDEHVANETGQSLTMGRGCICWKCGSPVLCRDFFCKCGAPQPLDAQLDYFEMLGCPRSVFVDIEELDRNLKKMQRAFHPDLFANKSADYQRISSTNSSTANKAFQTLMHPMHRVQYLLRLLGSSVLEEDGGDHDLSAPPALLMEIMEARERLEHCSSKEEAEVVLTEMRTASQECLRTMDEVLRMGGGKDELVALAIRLRYLHRTQEEARSVMHRLEDSHSGPSVR